MYHKQSLFSILEMPEVLAQLLYPFFALISLVLLVFVNKWLFFPTPRDKKNLPPSPSKFPILGNLHQLGLLPHRSLRALAEQHGPLMLLHLGRAPTLIVSSADAAQEILKTHDLIFSNRPNSAIPRRLLYDFKDLSLAPYGEYWRQMRSICVLQLLSTKRVQSFQIIREEETALLVKRIEQCCLKSLPIDLNELFSSLTNDVICRVAFGRKYGGKKFRKLLEEFGSLLGVFNVGDFIPWLGWINHLNGLNARVEKVFKELDCFLDQVIDDHMTSKKLVDMTDDRMDLVDVLLDIQKTSNNGGISLGRDNIKAIILDMFAAGADTIFTALEWTMAEVLRHPKVMQKIQEESRRIIGDKPNITENDVDNMHYLKSPKQE